jgi:hypothetical protein
MALKEFIKASMVVFTSVILLRSQVVDARKGISEAVQNNAACKLIIVPKIEQIFGGQWAEPIPIPAENLSPNDIAGCRISTEPPHGTASMLDVYISTKAQRYQNGNFQDLETSMNVSSFFHGKPIAGVGDRALGYWVDSEENLGNGMIVIARGETLAQVIFTNQYRVKANLSKLALLCKSIAPLLP